jgi:hypothetical protein
VDEDSVVFKKLQLTEQYDQGTITFSARNGKLIDLEKLHESIWATRLSGGTRSGLVSLEVTTIGHLFTSQGKTVLQVAGTNANFVLGSHPEDQGLAVFKRLPEISQEKMVKLTGLIDNYRGRWPDVLKQKPPQPRRILVTRVDVLESSLDSKR